MKVAIVKGKKGSVMDILTPEELRFIKEVYSRDIDYIEPIDENFLYHLFITFTFLDCPAKLKDFLELSRDMKVNFLRLFKKYSFMNADLSHVYLIGSPECFKLLTDFGVINSYYGGEYQLYLDATSRVLYRIDIEMSKEVYRRQYVEEKDSNIPYKFRSYQLLCLHALYKHRTTSLIADYEEIAKILWSSIPDPVLTMAEFRKSFCWMTPESQQKAMETWEWYSKLVGDPACEEKCPRSLEHLSRCAIRNCLRTNFQLPDGIKELNIPKRLKHYLRLRDVEYKL